MQLTSYNDPTKYPSLLGNASLVLTKEKIPISDVRTFAFIKSILLGTSGAYRIFGIDVEFRREMPLEESLFEDRLTPLNRSYLSRFMVKCLQNNIFRRLIMADLHVFIHEMSHALADKKSRPPGPLSVIITGASFSVELPLPPATDKVRIYTQPKGLLGDASSVHTTFAAAAGPLANMLFSSCQLVAAAALKNYISYPVASVLALSGGVWMFGELYYACQSLVEGKGDFSQIASKSKKDLCIASTALVGTCAAGLFGAISLW